MLGISLDSKTITKASHCTCTTSVCKIDDCECEPFCVDYLETYNKIKSAGFTKSAFLTFNPKPLTESAFHFRYGNDYDVFKEFHKSYVASNKNIINYILVAELTKKGQMHYHMYFSFKNKVSVIKQLVQPMYFHGNILILYGAEPKLGLHYLFKESATMTEYFEGADPFIIF